MMGSMTDTLTGSQWCERYGVTFDWSAIGYKADEDGWEHHAYTVTLTRGETVVSFPWRQGLAVDDEPTADAVLPALRSDAEAGGQAHLEFCQEFGLDPDSLRDFRTWEACKAARTQLYDFMDSEAMWQDFLSVSESD